MDFTWAPVGVVSITFNSLHAPIPCSQCICLSELLMAIPCHFRVQRNNRKIS